MKRFSFNKQKPFVIAGPCLAESYELMETVAKELKNLSEELHFDYIFKASFDKANRTSSGSERGYGWESTKEWFRHIKNEIGVPVTTDIHEPHQAKAVAEVCDLLQIPAFLCRQTDLIQAAVETGKTLHIKKGQFLSPGACSGILEKVKHFQENEGDTILTERGSSFGYGDLIVDMRSFQILSELGSLVCFDLTHSLQKPASGTQDKVTRGVREFAPSLARAAMATSYVDGIFLEVHTDPSRAQSDKSTQLNLQQTRSLLGQVIPLWYKTRELKHEDHLFRDT